MNPDDIEFIAENELVQVISNFNSPVIALIKGNVGPFRAGLTTHVPLWLAVNLRQRRQCKIVPPSWMNVDDLEECKTREKNLRIFTKMPSDHYIEVAKLLLDCSSDDIPQADEIRTIIKDIWDIRMAKIRNSVNSLIKNSSSFAALDNLTMFEINSMMPLVPACLSQIMRLKKPPRGLNTQSQFPSSILINTTNTTNSL
ncbi:DNA replication complex GINS protein PSF2 [Agrilus planipennis]|uniref:DNA replication complex GINS protein PSF2 n=1 Tax=Agrilus planipennis TaxID=224129 RepID=A0A1W4X7B4_AGRPL|nr:DNA replication complex GINS protein PSF2 [Agrilus planipennis]